MNPADLDPRRLDLTAFARSGGRIEGRWPVRRLPRVLESTVVDALPDDAQVAWSAAGEWREPPGRSGEAWLRLQASTRLPLECQRCLMPVETPVEVDRSILFVEGEDAAAVLDTERDEDVLALPRALDLQALIEDELLLALPLVPRHDACPNPLPTRAGDPDVEIVPNPFEALAALKKNRPLN